MANKTSEIPKTMNAIVCVHHGGIENLQHRVVPTPEPGPDEVLIQVKASGVNPVDTKVRGGKYRDIPTFYDYAPKENHILGFDCAGIVVALGSSKIDNIKIGDRVVCTASFFGYGSNAEYVPVKAIKLALIPDNVSFADAASLPVVGLTAFEGLEERLEVKKDEKVGLLIVNGAGGVGSIVIQLAAQHYRLPLIIATASRPESQQWCKDLGATHVVDHSKDVAAQVKEIKASLREDIPLKYVYLAHRTDWYLPVATEVLEPFGKIVAIQETDAEFKGWPMAKSLTLSWEYVGTKIFYNVGLEENARMLSTMLSYISTGKMLSPLTETGRLTVHGLREAHEKITAAAVKGKLVLVVDNEESNGKCFQ